MKKVIFICLLSISACWSQTTTPKAEQPVDNKGNIIVTTTTPTTPASLQANATNAPQGTNPNTTSSTTDNKASNNTAEDNHAGDTGKPRTDTAGAEKNATKPNTDTKPSNGTINGEGVGPNNPPIVTTSTEAPATKDNQGTTEKSKVKEPAQTGRSFDGASFVGGIVLTLGLLAIGFMGFKYYKNQTERNYHTL